LNVGPRQAGGFKAPTERITYRQAYAPGRVVVRKDLAERAAESESANAGDRARKAAGPQKLRATEAVAPVRRLEAHVRQALILEEVHGCFRVIEIVTRSGQVESLVERLGYGRIDVGRSADDRRFLRGIDPHLPERCVGWIDDQSTQRILRIFCRCSCANQ